MYICKCECNETLVMVYNGAFEWLFFVDYYIEETIQYTVFVTVRKI
jgi:hypothetical protein